MLVVAADCHRERGFPRCTGCENPMGWPHGDGCTVETIKAHNAEVDRQWDAERPKRERALRLAAGHLERERRDRLFVGSLNHLLARLRP